MDGIDIDKLRAAKKLLEGVDAPVEGRMIAISYKDACKLGFEGTFEEFVERSEGFCYG